MIAANTLLKTRSPELSAEIGELLGRAGRGDLLDGLDRFAITRVGQDRVQGRISLYGRENASVNSLELDARGVTVVVDLSAKDDFVAVHVRPPED